jgi:hypothetical protein
MVVNPLQEGFMSSRFLLPLLLLTLCLQATPSQAGEFLEGIAYPGGHGALAMATGDFNGDGHLDLALPSSYNHTVSIVLGNSDGSFQLPLEFDGGTAVDYLAVGDFNGDGKLDVVTVNHLTDTINVLLGKGDGTLQAPVSYSTGGAPRSVTSADVNGDGKLDVITANKSGTVSVLLGHGDASFAPHVEFAVGNEPLGVAVGDFNRDSKADILVATDDRISISLLLGNGDGPFKPTRRSHSFMEHTGLCLRISMVTATSTLRPAALPWRCFWEKATGLFSLRLITMFTPKAGLRPGM